MVTFLVGGWFFATPLKNDERISWDDEIPNYIDKNVPKHQPEQ